MEPKKLDGPFQSHLDSDTEFPPATKECGSVILKSQPDIVGNVRNCEWPSRARILLLNSKKEFSFWFKIQDLKMRTCENKEQRTNKNIKELFETMRHVGINPISNHSRRTLSPHDAFSHDQSKTNYKILNSCSQYCNNYNRHSAVITIRYYTIVQY